jgi:phage terminase small subunit
MATADTAELAPPEDLSPAAAELWQELVDELLLVHDVEAPAASDLLTIGDVCRARDQLDEVAAAIARDGAVVAGSKGQPRAHPLVPIQLQLRGEVARGLDRLRLEPGRRARAEELRGLRELTRGD